MRKCYSGCIAVCKAPRANDENQPGGEHSGTAPKILDDEIKRVEALALQAPRMKIEKAEY